MVSFRASRPVSNGQEWEEEEEEKEEGMGGEQDESSKAVRVGKEREDRDPEQAVMEVDRRAMRLKIAFVG
jgi:hypothetical protein